MEALETTGAAAVMARGVASVWVSESAVPVTVIEAEEVVAAELEALN
jgi:hypothetical protein